MNGAVDRKPDAGHVPASPRTRSGVVWALSTTLVAAIALGLAAGSGAAPQSGPKVVEATMLRTPAGVAFALVGSKGPRPAPLLVILGGEARQTAEGETTNRVGSLLLGHGVLSASLDIPGYGADHRDGEPPGLRGWRARLDRREDLLSGFKARLGAMLDFLVAEGYADAGRLAVAGVSRGGFVALHAAAADARLGRVVAFAPVTDLLALSEFRGMTDPDPARALDVMRLAETLAKRPVLVSIGHSDERVGSRHAIDFGLRLMELSPLAMGPMSHFWSSDEVKLVVTLSQGAGGHSSYQTAHDEAAEWLLRRFNM
jgi:esterase FrsA